MFVGVSDDETKDTVPKHRSYNYLFGLAQKTPNISKSFTTQSTPEDAAKALASHSI